MGSPAVRMFHRLEGLFCVYKPAGVHWKLVRDTIETNLLKGVNATPARPLPHEVRFLPSPNKDHEVAGGLALRAASVPVLSKHPLVTGPEFQHIKVGVGHRLDVSSSGVLVLAVGNGNRTMRDLYRTRTTRDYSLQCEFGMATQDFTDTGRVVERTTYVLLPSESGSLYRYSSVDMSSQEAYELAAKGLLGPDGKSVPILTGLRCVHFQPPNFTLEVQCLNETQKYLRKVVHEMGLELRSTAVCKGVRRTRDGPFTLQHALTRHHWTAADVAQAMQQHRWKKRSKGRCGTVTDKAVAQTPGETLAASQEDEANRETTIAELQCS
uniref:TruB pseudouridine (psi) synthase family member 2 n=1 Tax=Fundulus heteroclitus TaxID=8078 RepID=A0A3Q2UH47_FUNHE